MSINNGRIDLCENAGAGNKAAKECKGGRYYLMAKQLGAVETLNFNSKHLTALGLMFQVLLYPQTMELQLNFHKVKSEQSLRQLQQFMHT